MAESVLVDPSFLVAFLRQREVLTADSDFRVYRRHGRQVIPLVAPWA
jgi:hypothetical protein